MTYDELLMEADSIGVTVKELPLQSGDGRCKGKRIAIRKDITSSQKADVLAEELGHYYTTVGRIIELDSVKAQKQELQARFIAYNKRIGLTGIVKGYQNRCQSKHELAEFLDVTVDFLEDAVSCYHRKYGLCVDVDNYVVFFEPALYVVEKF